MCLKALFRVILTLEVLFMLKKFTCIALSALIMVLGTVCVSAKSKSEFSLENLNEYCTLINGCSKASLKNYNDEDVLDAIAYCGLDLKSPKVMFYLSMYYFGNDIDVSKITSDPTYCTQKIIGLDSYLSKKGIANSKSDSFLENYQSLIYENKLKFSTVGAYTFKAKKSTLINMLNDGYADFVIVGTGFMLKQGDVNADGKINEQDVNSIQLVCANTMETNDLDEEKFINYACDLNNDDKITVNDVTALQQNMTA